LLISLIRFGQGLYETEMEKKLTIVHVRASNFVGGPEKQIIEHLKRLDPNRFIGWLVSYIESEKGNELLQVAQREGIRRVGIPMACQVDYRSLFRLLKLIHRLEPDLLCVHGYKACLMGWWAGKRAKVPVLAYSRGDTGENKKVALYEWLERRILPKVDGVIAVSEGQKRKCEALGIQSQKIWVVRNAISVNAHDKELRPPRKKEIFQELKIPLKSKLVVTAGRLSPEKGQRYFVEAIAKLGEKGRDSYFVFCGDGPCREDLEKQARDLGVLERCRFAGFRHDLPEIFSAMDLLVLPSLTEGLPNVLLEALASAKPVVATAVGGVPEIVDNEVNGLLVPPQRADLLSEAIERILLNPQLGQKMGISGYTKVKSDFTFETQTRKLEARYNQIVSAFGGAAG
jgi:glycosyltransferase involved in cell wall biosynthesis